MLALSLTQCIFRGLHDLEVKRWLRPFLQTIASENEEST